MSEAFKAAAQSVAQTLQALRPVHPDMIADLVLFHQTFGAPVVDYPAIPQKERQVLRLDLVGSEHQEFLDAWTNCQEAHHYLKAALEGAQAASTSSSLTEKRQLGLLVQEWNEKSHLALAELADAIADSIYVLIGTALEYGIPLSAIWNEVQRSNMAKLWTQEEVQQSIGHLNLLECNWTCTPIPGTGIAPGARRFVVKNQLGKVQKPPSWTPPDLLSIIKKAAQS